MVASRLPPERRSTERVSPHEIRRLSIAAEHADDIGAAVGVHHFEDVGAGRQRNARGISTVPLNVKYVVRLAFMKAPVEDVASTPRRTTPHRVWTIFRANILSSFNSFYASAMRRPL